MESNNIVMGGGADGGGVAELRCYLTLYQKT